MTDMYVHLLSNGSMDKFPENTLNAFTVAFDSPLQLTEHHKVGLMDLSISNNFFNVGHDAKMKVSYVHPVRKSFRVETDFETDLRKALAEFNIAPAKDGQYVLPKNVRGLHLPRAKRSEREATSVLLQHGEYHVGRDLVLNSETSSLRNTLSKYFEAQKIEGASIQYANNVYTLKVPAEFTVPESLFAPVRVEDKLKVYVARPEFVLTVDVVVTVESNVPRGYYASPRALLTAINDRIGGPVALSYDEHARKFHIHVVTKGSTLALSEYLAVLLGFDSQTVFTEDAISASETSVLEPPFSNILVYTDIVVPSYVGSSKKQILKILPFHYEKDKHIITYRLDTIQYFNLTHYEIGSVSIALADESGRPLPFRSKGRTTLTLHFKYAPPQEYPRVFGPSVSTR